MNRLVVIDVDKDVLDRALGACTAGTCLSELCEDRRLVIRCLPEILYSRHLSV